jgi:hypothetical protein
VVAPSRVLTISRKEREFDAKIVKCDSSEKPKEEAVGCLCGSAVQSTITGAPTRLDPGARWFVLGDDEAPRTPPHCAHPSKDWCLRGDNNTYAAAGAVLSWQFEMEGARCVFTNRAA